MNNNIEQLLQHPNLWRATANARQIEVISTGYQQLDQQLHDGGWPKQGLTELLLPRTGIGELRLLLPALARLSEAPGWILFVGFPFLPYAAALQAYGIDLSRILIVQSSASSRQLSDLLWATEQALASGSCHCVISWLAGKPLPSKALRKLQLAAQKGGSMGVLFRAQSEAQQVSPAKLRICLSSGPHPSQANTDDAGPALQLEIIKQPGGWGGQRLSLANPLAHLRYLETSQLPVYVPSDRRVYSQASTAQSAAFTHATSPLPSISPSSPSIGDVSRGDVTGQTSAPSVQ